MIIIPVTLELTGQNCLPCCEEPTECLACEHVPFAQLLGQGYPRVNDFPPPVPEDPDRYIVKMKYYCCRKFCYTRNGEGEYTLNDIFAKGKFEFANTTTSIWSFSKEDLDGIAAFFGKPLSPGSFCITVSFWRYIFRRRKENEDVRHLPRRIYPYNSDAQSIGFVVCAN